MLTALNNLTFIQGFVLGGIIGFVFGVGAMIFIGKSKYKGEDILAWILAITWVSWHLLAAFTSVAEVPPTMYDLVSGGAVGFIFGEKFFDYITGSIGRIRK